VDIKEFAGLLVEYCWEQLDHIEDSERDDLMLEIFSEALCGLMVSYKIMNPSVNELTFVESFCEEFRENFQDKFGMMETLRSDNFIN